MSGHVSSVDHVGVGLRCKPSFNDWRRLSGLRKYVGMGRGMGGGGRRLLGGTASTSKGDLEAGEGIIAL